MKKIKKDKKKLILIVVGITFAVLLAVFVVMRAEEDYWYKDVSGNWVKHGNPSAPKPE